MSHPLTHSFKRKRKAYCRFPTSVDLPNLIEVQVQSYKNFLQGEVKPDERLNKGLHGVFTSVFPIKDFSGNTSVDFVSYSFDDPKYSVDECRQRGMTYSSPLKVVIRLVVMDVDEDTGVRSIRDVKEQEVFFGEIPLMTERGTFIINGTERVVVSQLHRSPGVFFDHDQGKTHSSQKLLYSARVIPYRGSWLDFEFDIKDHLYVRIDRRRKLYATVLFKALGATADDILHYFYKKEVVEIGKDGVLKQAVDIDLLRGQKASQDIVDPKSGDVVVKKNRKFTTGVLRKFERLNIQFIEIDEEYLVGKIVGDDIIDDETGEVIVPMNTELTSDLIKELILRKINSFKILFIDQLNVDGSLRETLVKDEIQTTEEALITIYKRLRPGDPPTLESAQALFEKLFFNIERYDLSEVGRLKLNHKLSLDIPLETTTLTKDDIFETIKYLLGLKNGKGRIDDIDHLGNRRVRAVGELLENQYRIGLLRIERAIKERMSLQEVDTLLPHDLINAKPVSAVVKEFFGSSQLSQFMDQINPLSEITHKRRLSALGPGGLTRERAGFEVRDVHTTHYGRICPVETPEGPNIGLITSLATYGKINKFGFIETPYRKIRDGKVTDDITHYSALDEQNHIIAQANVPTDKKGKFTDAQIPARVSGEFSMVRAEEIDLMDVATNQLVSAAASLIPFLQNDDANRALMGANMQRQAVPLMETAAPIVGTGIEGIIARDSGTTVVAKRDGIVEFVDSRRIAVRSEEKDDPLSVGAEVDIYNLIKYQRSNQDTCINQKPIVNVNNVVKKGDIIADGFASDIGELALGRNIVVAFMPWHGYNFEDSILVSERIVRDEVFTSFHIQEFECVARDTKLGKEEITNDIPNVGDESLKSLDASGIISIGAHVKPGDILVGKITPKGESSLTAEEKLLRAIFGEKAGDIRDTSLRVPPGVVGTAIAAKVFIREGVEKDERAINIEENEIQNIRADERDKIDIIKRSAYDKIKKIANKQVVAKTIENESGEKVLKSGVKLSEELIQDMNYETLVHLQIKDIEENAKISKIIESLKEKVDLIRSIAEEKIAKIRKGDELPPGVIKMVKVYVAIKRKLSVGDKMAGRHGNKGVISVIMPLEDMPYLEDGTPVDLVLNPLGVPSRMNVGQILECHLGWAAYNLGLQINEMMQNDDSTKNVRKFIKEIWKGDKEVEDFAGKSSDQELEVFIKKYKNGIPMANPVFDGASEEEIKNLLKLSSLPEDGKTILFDGRTGNPFENKVTVGVMYMLKLHHLVEDKIHARSIGPYSLVTQQPLGGKAQFGGQRLGEMEVWAMEAYGAAYALQGFLTVKSDDVVGRTKIYESIVRGDNVMTPGLPESFNVLVKELQALVLDVRLVKTDDEDSDELNIVQV